MKITFIGFGETSYCMAKGFIEGGVEDIWTFDVMQDNEIFGPHIRWRAEDAGVIVKNSLQEAVTGRDIVIAAVPTNHTVELAGQAAPFLSKGQLYVDVSASTPGEKFEVADAITGTGALLADCALLGPLTGKNLTVPQAVSGPGAKQWCHYVSTFKGTDVSFISEREGDASAIKLVRTIFIKGFNALMLEMLQAADYYNVTEEVIESISKSLDGKTFRENMQRLIPGIAVHADRRVHEIEGTIEMLDTAGIDYTMSQASRDKHAYVAAHKLNEMYGGKKPATYQQVIDDLKATEGKK